MEGRSLTMSIRFTNSSSRYADVFRNPPWVAFAHPAPRPLHTCSTTARVIAHLSWSLANALSGSGIEQVVMTMRIVIPGESEAELVAPPTNFQPPYVWGCYVAESVRDLGCLSTSTARREKNVMCVTLLLSGCSSHLPCPDPLE